MPSDTDREAAIWDLLQQYSRRNNIGSQSLSNAFQLASGNLQLVILMQEPCNIAGDVSYDVMLGKTKDRNEQDEFEVGSPTLQEVEHIIQVESHGNFGLRDIPLVDVNMLCPPSLQEKSNFTDQNLEEAQVLCLKIIRLIEPKVVLILTCVAVRSAVRGIRLFSSSLKEAGTTKHTSLGKGEDCHPFVAVKGFHPSIFLRRNYIDQRHWHDEEVRCAKQMLHICFRKAILELENKELCRKDESFTRNWTARWA